MPSPSPPFIPHIQSSGMLAEGSPVCSHGNHRTPEVTQGIQGAECMGKDQPDVQKQTFQWTKVRIHKRQPSESSGLFLKGSDPTVKREHPAQPPQMPIKSRGTDKMAFKKLV